MSSQLTIPQVKARLEELGSEFARTLPPQISRERFSRVALTAIQQNPSLLTCSPDSLWNACLRAAEDGLLPDGREGAITIRKTREGGRVAVWMPMVQGLIGKAKRRGSIVNLVAHIVYEGEDFSIVLGDDDRIVHRRDIGKVKRGKEIMVYAIATLRDGTKEREHMTWDQVQYVRRTSSTPDSGPWVSHTDEMARKTVIRRLAKRLPWLEDGDDELRRTVERVDELYTAETLDGAGKPERAAKQAGAVVSERSDFAGQQADRKIREAVGPVSAGESARAVGVEGAAIEEPAVAREGASKLERARPSESAETNERAEKIGSADTGERAETVASAVGNERAGRSKSAVLEERAIEPESAVLHERAEKVEGAGAKARKPKFSEWLDEFRGRAAACKTRTEVEYLAMDETANAVLLRGTEKQILELTAVLNAARVRLAGTADAVAAPNESAEPAEPATAGDELYK